MNYLDLLLVVLLLINIYALGVSRLGTLIKIMAFQGIILSLLPLAMHKGSLSEDILHFIILCGVTFLIKAILIPVFVSRAIYKVKIKREIEPYIGFTPSLFVGILIMVLSFWVGNRLALPFEVPSDKLVPVALATLLSGLMIVVSRRKAITQVLGYVLFESGIYIFSLTLSEANPLLVEMGILLDVFVAVFIMGITLLRIKDVFDDLDVGKFVMLRD